MEIMNILHLPKKKKKKMEIISCGQKRNSGSVVLKESKLKMLRNIKATGIWQLHNTEKLLNDMNLSMQI